MRKDAHRRPNPPRFMNRANSGSIGEVPCRDPRRRQLFSANYSLRPTLTGDRAANTLRPLVATGGRYFSLSNVDFRMRRLRAIFAVGIAVCAGGIGCNFLNEPKSAPRENPFLKPLSFSESGITFDVMLVRLPKDDAENNAAFWTEIDEQQLPANSRRQWEANGLRVGLVGRQLPAKLAQLLDPAATTQGTKRLLSDDPRPTVTRSLIHMVEGNRNEIVASSAQSQLPLVINEEGQIRGKTYDAALSRFVFKAFTQPDGRVRFEIVPEIEYGESRPHYVGEDGTFLLDTSRPKQSFDKMAIEAKLSPGQLLVLGHAYDRPGSLGYHFLTEEANGRRETKFVIIRVGQVHRDDLFQDAPTKPAAE